MKSDLPLTDAQRGAGWLPVQLPLLRQILTGPVSDLPGSTNPPERRRAQMNYITGKLLTCPAIAGSEPLTGLVEEWERTRTIDPAVAASPIRAPFDNWWCEFFEPAMQMFGGIYFERERLQHWLQQGERRPVSRVGEDSRGHVQRTLGLLTRTSTTPFSGQPGLRV